MSLKYWSEHKTIQVEWYNNIYIVVVEVYWYTDPNYGADIDGNRGESRDFIDEVIINEVRDIDGNYVEPVPEELENLICESV